jgi:hypothetical protein
VLLGFLAIPKSTVWIICRWFNLLTDLHEPHS